MTDRQQKILSLINKVTKKSETPSPDESLFESGYLDSFALPDLVAELEEAFSIRIPDSDLNPRKFDSIERIESYLDQRG
ncbi:MAG: acyl carrier protein [Bryobacterales bacterium]|nr:acyl carrier protein [Bryobacterales bacterium]